jgi:hypothetical protein
MVVIVATMNCLDYGCDSCNNELLRFIFLQWISPKVSEPGQQLRHPCQSQKSNMYSSISFIIRIEIAKTSQGVS